MLLFKGDYLLRDVVGVSPASNRARIRCPKMLRYIIPIRNCLIMHDTFEGSFEFLSARNFYISVFISNTHLKNKK